MDDGDWPCAADCLLKIEDHFGPFGAVNRPPPTAVLRMSGTRALWVLMVLVPAARLLEPVRHSKLYRLKAEAPLARLRVARSLACVSLARKGCPPQDPTQVYLNQTATSAFRSCLGTYPPGYLPTGAQSCAVLPGVRGDALLGGTHSSTSNPRAVPPYPLSAGGDGLHRAHPTKGSRGRGA